LSRVVSASDPGRLEEAARVLREGGVVAFPTETVYGLGADATNARAVARVFEIKQRPVFDPLIVHVGSPEAAVALWAAPPPEAFRLMDAFWPGPLTLVLPKNEKVLDLVTSGLPSVAVRMPRNPHALALIRHAGRPIAAPSANPFGRTSPTTAAAVAEDLGDGPDVILDGGPCEVGVESTVLKIENGKGLVLRPGGVPLEEIAKFLPVSAAAASPDGAPSESPGRLESHYAPRTPLVLLDGPLSASIAGIARVEEKRRREGAAWPRVGLLAFGPGAVPSFFAASENLSVSGDLREAASNLFQAVRKLDRMGLDLILAENVPSHGIGAAILDRLSRASTGRGIGTFEKTIQGDKR
jgi:L-threonylcarbamoyladenylate synthase